RATQTVLYLVARDLCRLLAPILSFTAGEAWRHLPGEREASVFLAGLPEAPAGAQARESEVFDRLQEIREAVSRPLELARREKRIGKGLDARVRLGASGELLEFLRAHADELRDFLIVSQLEVVEGAVGEPAPELAGL